MATATGISNMLDIHRRMPVASVPVAGLLFMVSIGAYGQASVSMVPRLSITQTLTDNVRLTSAAQQGEQITQISPGIYFTSTGGRVKGFFDYAVNEIVYAQNSSPSQHQNALTTAATLEVVDNWMLLDVSGAISQQAISAFGTQSNDNTAINANKTEVSSYRVSPSVRGRIGSSASYEARYSRTVTQSAAATGSGVAAVEGAIKLGGSSAFKNLGWSAQASQQRVDYSAGRPTENERLNLGLSYSITPQFSVSMNGGHENNDFTSLGKEGYGTSDFGVNWQPSEMTRFSATRSNRSFGDAHSLRFEHRTARTAWTFTDAKDVSATPSQTGYASQGAIYDILFTQFASIEPDPIARSRLVNVFLQANSINPNTLVIGSFLTSAVSLQRRQDLAIALLGVRDTLTLVASRSEGRRLDTMSSGVDDFTRSSVVRQHGFSANYLHRLTPDYALGVLASKQITAGESSLQDATLNLLSITLTGKVGKKTSASVGARRVVSSAGAASYGETALTVNLIVQF